MFMHVHKTIAINLYRRKKKTVQRNLNQEAKNKIRRDQNECKRIDIPTVINIYLERLENVKNEYQTRGGR